jgi:uncharacterized membrane protein
MLFLGILVAAYAATWLVPRLRGRTSDQWRYALAAGMAVAGLSHLLDPTPFIQHLPVWVPARELLVFLSGIAEIALGAALLAPPPYRRLAGFALAAYLVAVFPGNIYVAVAGVDVQGQPGGLYAWLRLPLQAVFVWLALWTTRRGTSTVASAAPPAVAPATALRK